jgi:hypothetical protein
MKCPSLFHLTNISEPTLSDISIDMPACFEVIGLVNLQAFHPKPVFISVNKMSFL